MPTPRPLSLLLLILGLSILPAPGAADAVSDWDEIALALVTAAKQLPPEGARTMAMVHVAIFDAVNAIVRTHTPYAFQGTAPRDASPEAAAAAAARGVLLRLFPARTDQIEAPYAKALADLPAGPSRVGGIAVGEAAASACLARREGDGSAAQERYRPATLAGVYVPTTLPVSSAWSGVRTWVIESADRFRPAPPPALGSDVWIRDYLEIQKVGARDGASRTPAETEAAIFWTMTGPSGWAQVVRAIAASRPAPLVEKARLFALANLAAADAFLAVFDAKYHYGFWRPITAIRNGDLDASEKTAPDRAWLPLAETPLHPEYPCAHCITAAAVATVLEKELGGAAVPAIEVTSPAVPGALHHFTRLADYVREVSQARIWAGVHYRNSTEVGEAMGREIGALVSRALPPRQR